MSQMSDDLIGPNSDGLTISESRSVLRIHLNRPEKRNALDGKMLATLVSALGDLAPEKRAVVLTASGTVFSAGLDLSERMKDGTPLGHVSSIEEILDSISSCPVPVVAAVQGDAIAGGCELALACDFVVASNESRFMMPLAYLGLSTTWSLTQRLIDLGGLTFTRQLLLAGKRYAAAQLADLGIIASAVDPQDMVPTVDALVESLVNAAPLSLKSMKTLIQRGQTGKDQIPHDDLDRIVERVRNSRDAHEGVAARLEKRAPVFEGR